MNHRPVSDQTLSDLQRQSFHYFTHEINPDNGLVADRTQDGSPVSVGGTGLALAAYPAAIELGFRKRAEVIRQVLKTLRFFRDSEQGSQPSATGYKGFYYHFLDPKSGSRAENCELSTIDTTLLIGGMLAAAAYFDSDKAEEREIRDLADELYRRVDWRWAQNGGATVTHGWTPEKGFLPSRWEGYSEAILLYVLGLGSPSFPLAAKSYPAWTASYKWKKVYDQEFLYAGPLFIHQLSHIWIDFRGIQDNYMRGKSIDYFENSRRATYAQQQYAIENSLKFKGYGQNCWGFSASDGPGPASRSVGGKRRRFYNYIARGIPYGPDDGTIAPWAAVASLPFAPEIVMPV
ncbi:MAG TPA: glucoamylase family protein, partial [Humisphaera sp.]|nr:glucoamylase family protein [Humisphaera sp.]